MTIPNTVSIQYQLSADGQTEMAYQYRGSYWRRYKSINHSINRSIRSICKAPLNKAQWLRQQYHDKIHKTVSENNANVRYIDLIKYRLKAFSDDNGMCLCRLKYAVLIGVHSLIGQAANCSKYVDQQPCSCCRHEHINLLTIVTGT